MSVWSTTCGISEEVKSEELRVESEELRVKNEELREESEESAPQEEKVTESLEDEKEPLFIVHFKKVVEARLADSDLSVDDLAAAMNLKVKSISGSSPVELLRTARLNRGYQLLLTTGKNVSEVAYDVGFTAPSYFTKCFKDEFGVSPSDLQAK